ncbi:hypothetical protein ASG36_16220 [Geodermatophilus sp. Leaf369]|uniref:hypothetical protein n=1 Tax=Geodermatophilus sp. Leaf369 TaxID=1736354 RepID=UPI0006F49938|nr:hypothetical protein [Geodermatophilus sp. Leaf369]KQS58080.1 hypothetical protein ASG36_16220 [Geodermatophilus sp. Leaf369]
MSQTVVLVGLAWGLLTIVGVVLLGVLTPDVRRKLLPAAPLLGASLLVVVLHTTGIFFSVRTGLVAVAALLVVLGGVAVRRGAVRGLADRRAVAWLVAGVVVAIPVTAVALIPTAAVQDSRVVSPNQSNDGVWYVSVSSWLEDNSILDVPVIGAGPEVGDGVPADGPAVSALTFPMRVGQELVQASLNVVTGTSPIVTFTPWMTLWVFLVPGGCIAAASVLGLRRGVGLAAGIVLASSALVVQQLYNQNAASLLGISLVPLVLACVANAVERRGVPLVLAGLMLSTLLGTYSEYTPFIAPALVAVTLLRRRGLREATVRAFGVVAWAIVLAPLAWLRAYQTLTGVRGGATESLPGALLDAPIGVIVSRLVGVGPLGDALEPSSVAPVLAGLVVLGVLLAVVLGPHRGLWIGFVAAAVPFIAYLSVTGVGYTQRRALEIAVPVLLFAAVAGWGAAGTRLWARLNGSGRPTPSEPRVARDSVGQRTPVVETDTGGGSRLPRRIGAAALIALAAVPVAVWAGVNTRSSAAALLTPAEMQARHVDTDFSDAVGWVQDVGGSAGEDVSVVVPSFFEQQWLALSLEPLPDVEYPSVRSDYFRTQSFWDGRVDRYWLVGGGVQVDADPGVVVYANDRFRLLDLSRGDAVMAAPFGLDTWNTGVRPDGGFTTLGDAQVLLVRSPDSTDGVALTVRAESAAALSVGLTAPDNPGQDLPALTAVPEAVEFALAPREQTLVVSVTATVPAGSDALNWIEMTGVERVP